MENEIEIGTKCIIAHYDFLENKNEYWAREIEILKITPKRFYTKSNQIFDKETLKEIKAKEHSSWNHKSEKLFFFDSKGLLQKRLELVQKRNVITNFINYSLIDFNKLSEDEIENLRNILKKGYKHS